MRTKQLTGRQTAMNKPSRLETLIEGAFGWGAVLDGEQLVAVPEDEDLGSVHVNQLACSLGDFFREGGKDVVILGSFYGERSSGCLHSTGSVSTVRHNEDRITRAP